MNLDAQFETLLKSWVQFQQDMMDPYLNSQSSDTLAKWEGLFRQPAESTKEWVAGIMKRQAELVQNTLDVTQLKWTDPTLMNACIDAAKSLLDDQANAQQQAIDTWFSTANAFEKQTFPGSWELSTSFFPMNPLLQWNNSLFEVFHACEKNMAAQKDYLEHLLPQAEIKKPHIRAQAGVLATKRQESHH